MKKANRFFIAIIFCFMLYSPLLTSCDLFGGNQSYNDLESDCNGKWSFSDFYVLNNQTLNTTRLVI